MPVTSPANANSATATFEPISDRALRITRMFNAPPAVVFQAWTQAALVRQWWAPASRGVSLAECTADVRVGGRYRYVMARGAEQMAFSGEYREVSPPSRLVYTQVFEPMQAAGFVLITVSFTDVAGQTRMVSVEEYPSAAVFKGAVDSGMESGARESLDQLDQVVMARA